MARPMVQDGTEVREMNDAEFAQYEIDQVDFRKREKAEKAKAAAREALLDRLGITAEEAQLLLGA